MLVVPETMALRIPHRYFRIVCATACIGGNRHRAAHANHAVHAFRAHARRTYCQHCMATSLMAHTRAVFSVLVRSAANCRQRSTSMRAAFANHQYLVPDYGLPPSARSARCSVARALSRAMLSRRATWNWSKTILRSASGTAVRVAAM